MLSGCHLLTSWQLIQHESSMCDCFHLYTRSSSPTLLHVHRDRRDYQGRRAQDVHLDFHTAPEVWLDLASIRSFSVDPQRPWETLREGKPPLSHSSWALQCLSKWTVDKLEVETLYAALASWMLGAGTAQWIECQTRDRKVAGSTPCRSGGEIFFSRVNFMCWLLFRYPFHPRVTAVARKRSWSFCQNCRWLVTAKHACGFAIGTWCMVVWCTQNAPRRQQFHVAPPMPAL